jgi:hypothetical protein
MHMKGVHVKSKLQHTDWSIIGRSMKAAPPVLSPSSFLPPPSSHCAFIPAGKIPACFRNYIITMVSLFKVAEV